MKANEFVKDNDIDVVKEIIKKASFGSHYRVDTQEVICCHNEQHFYFQDLVKLGVDFIRLDDLKRLVESWELVGKCGGLESLKAWLNYEKRKTNLSVLFHCNKPPVLLNIEAAEKAIADVESCQ